MKERILIFSLVYLPDFVGGAEVAVSNLTENITEFDFDLITLRMSSDLPVVERVGNVTVYRIGPAVKDLDIYNLNFKLKFAKKIFPLLAILKAVKLSFKNRYCLVWSIMANQAGFAGLFYKKIFPNSKFVLTLQEGDSVKLTLSKVKYLRWIYDKIFLDADCIQVISNFLRKWAIDMGVSEEKIEIIPNGVDNNCFYNMSIGKKERIITASRLVPKNGIEDLVDAMEYLPNNFNLIILGDGILRDFLEEKIKEKKLDNRVVMVGYVNQKKMNEYFNDAGIFCRPSLTEGLGNVFLEAMSSGLPVLATSVGGIPDIISDHYNGIFVDLNNPKSIAEKVIEVYSNDILRNDLIKNGILFSKQYSWDKISIKMLKLFKKILYEN